MSEPTTIIEVIHAIEHNAVSAIIRTSEQEVAANAMEAAVAGGFRTVEFTLTTPGALELIAGFAKDPRVTVGAGTVLTVQQARAAHAAGARFLVSPITDPAIIAEARSVGAVVIPGAQTPTEMESAHRSGADFVKVFPAPAGGVDFIRAIRGPLPHLRLFPTAGVTPENVIDFLNAGCAGVGFVRTLFEPQDLIEGNMDAIRSRAAVIVERVARWRSHNPS